MTNSTNHTSTNHTSTDARIVVTMTALSKAGDLYTWDGGEYVGVYEEAAPWHAGDEPDITIRVSEVYPFTRDGFISLLTRHALMWAPDHRSATAEEFVPSRTRVAPDAESAVYRLLGHADGGYTVMLFQQGDGRRNEVKIFGPLPTRMDALGTAQHWEDSAHLDTEAAPEPA